MTEENKIISFAHRGASANFPENTMPAFEKAVQLGIDYIETDVHFTKDKRFAVIHDEQLDRTTNGSGCVADYTLSELKSYDAGYYYSSDGGVTYPFRNKGITICSLEELLETFPDCKFNIDLKDKNTEQVTYFIDTLEKYNAQRRIIAASKHFANLQAVRKKCPDIATSFSVLETIEILFLYKSGLLFLKMNFNGIALQIPEIYGSLKIVTKSFVRQMHEKDLQVHVWTVNNEEDMIRFIEYGVDGIMSDDPELLVKVLGRKN